jgi:hypothetical protein
MKLWRRLKDLFEIHLRKNVKLVDRLLRAVAECVPQRHRERYEAQLGCKKRPVWVLETEVDLRYPKGSCDEQAVDEWRETKLAEVVVEDSAGRIYRLSFYAVGGKIFSIEGNLPFKKLRVEDIKRMQVECEAQPAAMEGENMANGQKAEN